MVSCERPPEGLRCPRCDSLDTKFCYYNNYNASQPRHFCKACKRYWTAGGTLRNVPVGGGLRKNKKSKLLHQVKDMMSSSSPDEFFRGAVPHPSISHDAFSYDVPRPLVFAPPLFMNSPVLSADTSGNGTPNFQAFRNPGPLDYGYFAENRIDGSHSMDPSLLSSLDLTHPSGHHGGNQLTLPGNLHHRLDVSFEHLHGSMALDQAQPYSGDVSEVPSDLSQASSGALKDHQLEHLTVINQCQRGNVEQAGEGSSMTGLGGHQSSCDRKQTENEKSPNEERLRPSSEQLMILPATQFREKLSTEDEDDELGNVVNVRYPFDWEQVSEVVFERMPDFFQLSGY